jgi:RNA polymerase sigma-32 factor
MCVWGGLRKQAALFVTVLIRKAHPARAKLRHFLHETVNRPPGGNPKPAACVNFHVPVTKVKRHEPSGPWRRRRKGPHMPLAETSDLQRGSRRFVKDAMKAPLLEAGHEQDLARRWREVGDERALHELTTSYMRLVIAMAARFRNYGLPMSELVQEGNVGLMQAAARFEPERQVRFSTYAAWWIRSSIQDYILRNWSIVRTGTTAAQKALFFNLRRLRALIKDTGDGVMTPENRALVATKLGVPEDDVDAMAARLSASDRSLNAPMAETGDAEWQDMIADDRARPDEEVEESRDSARRAQWLATALKDLSPREMVIIQQRRLVDEGVTLEALGKQLGISKERVRQIEHHAMKKLRAALIRVVGDPVRAGLIDG